MNQQVIDNFLQAGDLITISFNNQILSAEGFKSSQVRMLPETNSSRSFQTLFRIESDAYYDTPICLVHLISGKYLCCGTRGIKLSANKNSSCQIIFKPIFICQIAVTRRVRIHEEVMISLADIRTRQDNLAWVTSPFHIKNIIGSEILIKRNEATNFQINVKSMRRKQNEDLSTCAIYQLINYETEKILCINQYAENIITFEKAINQHDMYIQVLKTGHSTHYLNEEIINFQEDIYIRSYKTNKFVSINIAGRVTLLDEPTQTSVFSLQSYHDKRLKEESFIKVLHKSTRKYVSINPTAVIQEFKLLNVFQLKKVPEKKMRDTLFINQLCNSLKQVLLQDTDLSSSLSKIKIKQLLSQILKFIYQNLQFETFLQMGGSKANQNKEKDQKANQQKKELKKQNEVSSKDFLLSQKLRINRQEQDLLGNVRILQILLQILVKLLPTLSYSTNPSSNEQQNHQQSADQNDILSCVMMATAGVCYNHASNTRIFIKGIQNYYEAIGLVDGTIECLYHIFKNNKQHLIILQGAQKIVKLEHSSKTQNISSLQILLSFVMRIKMTPEMRVKIIKLLEIMCVSRITSASHNIFRHQVSIMKALNSKKLQGLILPMIPNEQSDLIIKTLTNHEEELQQILMWKNKYEGEINLLEAQLNLLASLCFNQAGSNLIHVQKIISQDVIYRYLKGNLTPEFRQIFMRLLIEIYLKSDNASRAIIICHPAAKNKKHTAQNSNEQSNGNSSRLISDSSDPNVQMDQIARISSSIHTNTLQKIQNLVLQVTRKAISNQIIDCSFYMNIKALRKFLELNILDQREVVQFKQILIDFVQRFSHYAFLQQEKKNLMIEILKIFQYYQELQKYKRAQTFITRVSFLKNPHPSEIEQQLIDFNEQHFDSSSFSQSQIKVLKYLLQESLDYQQQDIFYHCSTLIRNIGISQSQFVGELKEKIIINSKWTLQLYNKMVKLIALVRTAVQDHKQLKGDLNQMAINSQQQKINQLLNQINYFFYQWPSDTKNKNLISPLTQNLLRQLQVHKIVILFLQENAGNSTNGSPMLITAMSTCVEFLLYFIQKNDTNLLLMAEFFSQGKNVFENAQFGQVKIIYKILKMPKSKEIVWRRIYRCLMTYIRASDTPNPYGVLSLMRLFHQQVPQQGKSFGKINKDNIQSFANVFINDQDFRMNLLKVKKISIGKYDTNNQYTFIFSTNNQDKLRYDSSWSLYLTQLSKLLLMLVEHSSQNNKIINLIKQCMPIEILIQDAFNCLDLIQNLSMQELSTTLMKKQLIKLFLRVHLESLREIKALQMILSFIQKNHQRILYARNDSTVGAQFLVQELRSGRVNDEGKVIIQTQFSNEKMKKIFMTNFNPVYTSVIIYYPFILKILHGISTSNKLVNEKQQIRQQIEHLEDIMFRKFKDLVLSKVTQSEFTPHFKDYINAIQTCQQIFRRKIGFNLSYEDDQQEEEDLDSRSENRLFVPSKISNLIGNLKVCQSAQQQKQRIIYQSLVHIILSNDIRENIRKSVAVRFFTLEKERVKFAQKITMSLMNKNRQQFGIFIDNLHFLCEMSTSEINEQILKMVILEVENEQQDLSNQKLAKFLEFSNQFSNSLLDLVIHTNDTLIQRMRTIPGRKNINKLGADFSKGFYPQKLMQRILKIVAKQKQAYSNYTLVSQLECQMLGVRLSSQLYNSAVTIQNCLLWIRNNLLMLTPQKKDLLHNLVIEVVELLKVYGTFIQQFKGKYVSKQLKNKIQLCYSILFHAISGCNIKNTVFLIERQVWTEANIILRLEDSYQKNLVQLKSSNQDLFLKLGSCGLKPKARNYINQLKTIYQNSKKFYVDYFSTDQQFPLLPAKAYYSTVKKWVIALLKEYKLLPPKVANQFLTRISISAIDKNIIDIYQKHQNLMVQFDIGTTEIDFIYEKTDEKYEIAKNMDFQNAVDLCSIKMFIENVNGEGQLQAEYRSFRINQINHKKITSVASEIVSFLRDLCLLMISCLIPLFKKPKKKQKGQIHAIMRFFFTKIGRIEMIFDDSIFMSQFFKRPECRVNKAMNKKFVSTINFVSIQLKNESILKNAMYFILFFVNQINYFQKYSRWRIMRFLDRHVVALKVISFILIIAQNILMIVNSTDQGYFTNIDFSSPFEIIQVLNMLISYTVLLKYFLKDVPLLIMRIDTQLARRAQSYGSNFKSYSFVTKAIIKASKILADTGMIYNIIYTLIVSMCLKNKLFASLVLLDVFFQVPTLTNLLYAIWRPKVQLMLAIISFTLIQYFFSIFMFFNFKAETSPFCDTLEGCFGFVFITTYKAVRGFVGYLFQKKQKAGQLDTNVSFFQVFEDIYIILIFQIFFALILSIIIDNFTQIRSNISERKANLESNCIVCNLDRSLFNVSTTINFKGHIAINHSIWDYFYFYQYILKKDPLFRNHFEREIYEKRNLDFLPNNYAKGIKQPQKDLSSTIDQILGN